jgi:P4 family phage/plasmid primase-like protien
MSKLIDAAIHYVRRGWPVHPLKPLSKVPATKHGCNDATTDERQIRAWWSENPNYNIGLRTGVLWFVLDVDSKHQDAAEWLESVTLPATITAITGTNGRHYLFRTPDFPVTNSTSKIGPHIDIRGAGGYIVAAPSVHPDTRQEYAWDCVDEFPTDQPAEAPQWLLDRLAPSRSQRLGPAPKIIPHGEQHDTLFRYACSMRSKYGMTEEEMLPSVVMLSKRCEIIPPERNIVKLVADVCKRYAPGMSPEYSSASGAPKMQPPGPRESGEILEAEYEASNIEVPAKLTPNAIADRLMSQHAFLNHGGVLYQYTGTHWGQIDTGTLKHLALVAEPRFSNMKRRSEIANRIIDGSRNDAVRWRNLEKFEIPLLNGVIDVRSMSLRGHRKSDFLQSCVPHEYDSSSCCPVWQECLDTYFGGDPDQEAKQDALQEFFGYCLMPHATYKKALLCKGESDCGKSTIPYLLRVLAGQQNCCAVGVESMDDPRKRAPLRGKLVNLLTELTSDAMIADGGFKTLVSTEEPILFDEKFLPPVLDVPIAKHVIVTNVLPTINDRSRGTFNRLLLISFNHVIPLAQQDRSIWDRLRGEINGILHWALYGAQRLFLNGGTFTGVGRVEVEEYRASQNPVVEWIAEACEVDAASRAPLPDMRDRFARWYGKSVTPQWFANLLRSAGIDVTASPVHFPGRKARAAIGLRLI